MLGPFQKAFLMNTRDCMLNASCNEWPWKPIPFRKTNCDIKFVEDEFLSPFSPNFHFLFYFFIIPWFNYNSTEVDRKPFWLDDNLLKKIPSIIWGWFLEFRLISSTKGTFGPIHVLELVFSLVLDQFYTSYQVCMKFIWCNWKPS